MKLTSNLQPPAFPSTFWDFVPFLCAGLLALLFTALLVFLVEDAADELPTNQANNRLVGLAEAYDVEKDQNQVRGGNDELVKMMRSYRPYGVPRKLLALPGDTQKHHQAKSSISRPAEHQQQQQQQRARTKSSAPILSMAKLIMHRHDQANKRARRARTQSAPTSPPPQQQEMQQTTTTNQLPISVVVHPLKEDSQPPSPPPFPYQQQQQQPSRSSSYRVTITRPSSLRSVSL